MTPNERHLRALLAVQGLFYLVMNLWALVATPSYLSYTNPAANLFEARSFAALALVLTIFFLVGAWRQDLLRPASFLGLGSAGAIALVELFHLPTMGWSLLWMDLIAELALAGAYVAVIFFRREGEEKVTVPAAPPQATADEARNDDASKDDPTFTGDPVVVAADEGTEVREEIAHAENADEDSEDAK